MKANRSDLPGFLQGTGSLYIVKRNANTARRVAEKNKLLKEEFLISKARHSLAAQILGIGNYRYSKSGELYFVHGNSQIKVTEHFPNNGKTMDTLLEDLILFSANQQS